MRNVIAVILVFGVLYGRGQSSVKGLYLHFSDYAINKVTLLKKNEYVKLHSALYRPYIEIVSGDGVKKVSKDTMFGYLDQQGTVYRFYRKEIYPVLFRGELILYKVTPVQNKVCALEAEYFFSRSSISAIRPLKKTNLRKEYVDNARFLEMLDELDDENLHESDEHTGYRINTLLKQSNL
jgi:hypothetical protein